MCFRLRVSCLLRYFVDALENSSYIALWKQVAVNLFARKPSYPAYCDTESTLRSKTISVCQRGKVQKVQTSGNRLLAGRLFAWSFQFSSGSLAEVIL